MRRGQDLMKHARLQVRFYLLGVSRARNAEIKHVPWRYFFLVFDGRLLRNRVGGTTNYKRDTRGGVK